MTFTKLIKSDYDALTSEKQAEHLLTAKNEMTSEEYTAYSSELLPSKESNTNSNNLVVEATIKKFALVTKSTDGVDLKYPFYSITLTNSGVFDEISKLMDIEDVTGKNADKVGIITNGKGDDAYTIHSFGSISVFPDAKDTIRITADKRLFDNRNINLTNKMVIDISLFAGTEGELYGEDDEEYKYSQIHIDWHECVSCFGLSPRQRVKIDELSTKVEQLEQMGAHNLIVMQVVNKVNSIMELAPRLRLGDYEVINK